MGHRRVAARLHQHGFLQVYLPTVVFVILFGLSMDYEVFLIGRMREYWDSSHDNRYAVAAGITHTARPITAAAAIMVVVFGSFVTANVLELKQLGLALAVAVALDAVVVRLVLVPALMRLFGTWNWWFPRPRPRRGDRVRPHDRIRLEESEAAETRTARPSSGPR
ncbi:MMPL family transporter [Rhodococcus opacus]|uniref:MMPL family transporter n=1 Tax=Rhodococcus opacus TaxID=37919 RepID=UPI003AADD919